MKKFCFDLDGTIFKGESLPHIARTNGLWEEYLRVATSVNPDVYDNVYANGQGEDSITSGCEGTDNKREEWDNRVCKDCNTENEQRLARYKENLLKRIAVLQKVPVKIAVEAIEEFEVNEDIVEFIHQHKDQCAVITSNLDCWVGCFLDSLGCEYHTSRALVKNGYITEMKNILDKKSVVNQYKAQGYEVVYIGDGLNDIDAMVVADLSVAFLASENSYKGLGDVCDYCCFNQEELIKLLREWS